MKELRTSTGMLQKDFAEYFNIPVRTLQDWESRKRTPPEYLKELIEYKLTKEDKIMRKIIERKLEGNKVKTLKEFTIQDIEWYLEKTESLDLEFNTVEEIEDAIDEFIQMQTEEYYISELKKEYRRMFDFKSFEDIANKEELIEFFMAANEEDRETTEEYVNSALDDGSITEVEYGYLLQEL